MVILQEQESPIIALILIKLLYRNPLFLIHYPLPLGAQPKATVVA